jgi:flagellar biosynthesis chaperone FliJ
VQDFILRLKSSADSQQRELEHIREKNSRLEQKLKNVQAYNEELNEQVERNFSNSILLKRCKSKRAFYSM